MSDSFVCSVCGETHEGLTTDRAYKLPDVVWEIPEKERTERAKFDSDLCMFGSRFFIRCILEIPFNDRTGYFGWGCWAEVERSVFERYLALYETDGSNEPLHEGKIANALPAYANSLGAGVAIQFRDSHERPSLELFGEDTSVLAKEQRTGIDAIRYHEILDILD